MEVSNSYEPMLNKDGSKNPKYVDLLEEDKPIAGQKFACISFVSPENILKQKELFFFEEFLKGWDLAKSIEKFQKFTGFLAYKYNLNGQSVMNDLEDFVKQEKKSLFDTTLEDEYKTFVDKNEEKIENLFNSSYDFQTSTRGIKIRGVYPTQEEAELRCKMLRELDPNHDVYVGPVGLWMPWEPEAYKTGRVEYLENELNQLMHEKDINETKAKTEFEKRIKETKQKAIEENKELALKHGNRLTQNIDEEGNLIGINSDGTKEEISVADIRKELFENENVVTDKDTDHGLSQLEESGTITIDKETDIIIDNVYGEEVNAEKRRIRALEVISYLSEDVTPENITIEQLLEAEKKSEDSKLSKDSNTSNDNKLLNSIDENENNN